MLIKFEQLIGNAVPNQNLRSMVQRDQIAQACLLAGAAGVGKKTAAWALASALVCQNPQDGQACGQCFACQEQIDIWDGGANDLKIEYIRELTIAAFKGPQVGRYWVGLIPEAENLTPQAANALLKILEEPNPQTVFILTAESPQNLLPTLVSRCRQFQFGFLSLPEMREVLARQGLMVDFPLELAAGSLQKALDFLQGDGFAQRAKMLELAKALNSQQKTAPALELEFFGKEPQREAVLKQLDLLLDWYRDLWVFKLTPQTKPLFNQDCLEQIQEQSRLYTEGQLLANLQQINRIRRDLKAGANIRLALESLFFQLA